MKKFDTRTITTLGVLIAIQIILARFFAIQAWNFKISFSFVPVVAAAILLGPVPAGIVGGVADFLGAILFPVGAYFPGFTLSAALVGVVFGLFLYHRRSPVRVLCAVTLTQLLFTLCLNTLWISMMYHTPYTPLLTTRMLQCAVVGPVQVAVILAMSHSPLCIGKKVLA